MQVHIKCASSQCQWAFLPAQGRARGAMRTRASHGAYVSGRFHIGCRTTTSCNCSATPSAPKWWKASSQGRIFTAVEEVAIMKKQYPAFAARVFNKHGHRTRQVFSISSALHSVMYRLHQQSRISDLTTCLPSKYPTQNAACNLSETNINGRGSWVTTLK